MARHGRCHRIRDPRHILDGDLEGFHHVSRVVRRFGHVHLTGSGELGDSRQRLHRLGGVEAGAGEEIVRLGGFIRGNTELAGDFLGCLPEFVLHLVGHVAHDRRRFGHLLVETGKRANRRSYPTATESGHRATGHADSIFEREEG